MRRVLDYVYTTAEQNDGSRIYLGLNYTVINSFLTFLQALV